MSRPKVFVILGPTSSGKSDLAVKLALTIKGEVISADSRQVYKGLDIGTGKITKKGRRGVPHYLLDVVNPKKVFTVLDYKKLAEEKVSEILARGKAPIICGGTGFYIDAVTSGKIFPQVPPNEKLRKILGKKTTEELLKTLKKLDAKRAKNIDPKNKRRIIRAIEVVRALGSVPEVMEERPKYNFIKIGLHLPPDKLKKKINTRLSARIRKGMLKEAQRLHQGGLSWKRMENLGLEYKFMALYLQNKITKEQMVEKLQSEIYHYAKRQMTWFKRDKDIKWFDASRPISFARFLS